MPLQDLAVVVLLMLIPLLAPAENGAQAAGFSKIAKALGVAAVKVWHCHPERFNDTILGLVQRTNVEFWPSSQ